MAIVATPTLESLCKTALRRAGQVAPSAGMIQEASNDAFMEVMNDIKLKSPTHPLLETSEITVPVIGVQDLAQPTKAHQVKSILLMDGPDEWRGTAQAGGNTSITLAATTDNVDDALIGFPIFTISGTGSLQTRSITDWDNTTKVATVDTAWSTNPSSDTTYLVANYKIELLKTSDQVLNYDGYSFSDKGLPLVGALEGEILTFNRPPDKVYPIKWTYYKDIDQIDWDSTQGDKILREWRTIIVAGITAYSADTYDDNRSPLFWQKYEAKLNLLQHESLETVQSVPYDPIY
jgi:hypothetical protein